MEKTSCAKKYRGLIAVILGAMLWIFSWYIEGFDYKIVRYVQVVILKNPYTAESVSTQAVFLTALIYAVISFLSVLIMSTGIISMLYEKPLFESGRKQICRNFAFFGLLPNVIVCCALGLMWWHMPAKPYGYVPPIIEIEPIIDFSSTAKGLVLYISTVVSYFMAYDYLFGIMLNANLWFNTICGVLWAVYAYAVLFFTTAYFEYGKWFLLFILVCYLILGLAVLVHKLKKEDQLNPKYEVFIVSLEEDDFDDDDDFNYDDMQRDFSIFMPSGKSDDVDSSN